MKTKTIIQKLLMLIFIGIITLSSVNAQKEGGLLATIQVSSPTCYGGTNGSIVINVSGGLEPYSFIWGDGSTSSSLTNVTSGTYSVSITDALGGLVAGDIFITQPTEIQISSSVSQVTNMFTPNGSININVNGGTPGYSYLWETLNGSGLQITNDSQSNLSLGKYSLTVKDNNGCEAQKDFIIRYKSIGNPTLPVVKNSSTISIQNINNDKNVEDDKIFLDMTGKQVDIEKSPIGFYLVVENGVFIQKIYKN